MKKQTIEELEQLAITRLASRTARCDVCDAPFLPSTAQQTRCQVHQGLNDPRYPVTRFCSYCDAKFTTLDSRIRYCSDECRKEGLR